MEQIESELDALAAERRTLEEQLSSGTLAYEELTLASQRIEQIIEQIDTKEMRWLELNE